MFFFFKLKFLCTVRDFELPISTVLYHWLVCIPTNEMVGQCSMIWTCIAWVTWSHGHNSLNILGVQTYKELMKIPEHSFIQSDNKNLKEVFFYFKICKYFMRYAWLAVKKKTSTFKTKKNRKKIFCSVSEISSP